jgi:hypothetical protein
MTGQASAGKSHGRLALTLSSATGIRKAARQRANTAALASVEAGRHTKCGPSHVAVKER